MVIKNYLYNLIYQMMAILLPIITIPYIARVLGTEGLGKYALTNAYAQYFILFGMLGLSAYSSREVAYVRDDKEKLSKVFWEINFLRFMTMGLALILYMIIFSFIIKSNYKVLYLMQALVVLSSLIDISWLFIGLENFKKTITRNMIVKFIGIVFIFTFIKDSSQVWLYALILGGTEFIGEIIMWFDIPKEIKFILPNIKSLVRHLKYSIRLFIPQIAINVYTMLDKVMLGLLVNESQVGMYDNSQKVIKSLVTVVTALATVTIPKMINLYINKKYEEFNNNVYRCFNFVSFLVFPMAFGLIGVCKSFVMWFYGSGFEGIIPMFYVGSFLIITIGWSSILGSQVLIAIKREKQFTMAVATGGILNIILNLLLINKYEGVGTTIASVIAEYSSMFLMAYFSRDILDIKKLFKSVKKYLLSSIAMLAVVLALYSYMNDTILSSIMLIFIGGIVYLIIMIGTKDENFLYGYKFIKGIFKNKTIKENYLSSGTIKEELNNSTIMK